MQKSKIKIKNKQFGFSLIEVLVSVLIVSALTLAIFNLIIYSLKVTADNKFRLAAAMIADQKMEYIRNLPYDSVGITGGIPNGIIPEDETISQNNGVFYVNTLIKYEDDPFDGIGGGVPNDTITSDYKLARVRVSWNGPFGQKNATASTIIAPRGMETDAGGGTLSILVFDANGLPVNEASVHIENSNLDPAVDFTNETSGTGRLNFPGAPESIEGYEITVTKTGYSSDYTTDRTVANPNPTKPHATVLEGQRTEISFAVDLLSNLTIKAVTASLPQNWQINTDTTEESQENPRLIFDNSGFIYIVWQDFRSSSDYRIYAQKYNSSQDAQWPISTAPEDIRVSTAVKQILPDILIDNNGDLYICWNDDTLGNQDAYLVKLSAANGSDIWGGTKKINTIADSKDQTNARIALQTTSNNIAVVWEDNRNTDIDIYMQLIASDKTQLWIPEIRVNRNPLSDGTKQSEPELAIDSTDNIYVVWTDERNGNHDIYAQKYDTSGAALWASDILINTDGGTTNQYSPDIAIDSTDNIYVVWTDERNGNQDIYAQKYDTDGSALWAEDLRVNIDTGTSAQYNPAITINPADDNPYVSWQDDRNGNLDIYASNLEQYGAETPVPNVPITVTGAKKIGENPIIYKYSQGFTTDIAGTVSLTAIEWDSYDISLQTGYATYAIALSNPVQPVNLEPNSSQTITLYLE
jgi:prepilin-type N-terminal cleavage/methylation domain-containing protein